MDIAAALIALTISQASAQPQADTVHDFLAGSWISDRSSGMREQGPGRVVFGRNRLHFSTHPEPILGMSRKGNLISVRTRAATYQFEELNVDAICMVVRKGPDVVAVPHLAPFKKSLRPTVRDGLMTVSCYQREQPRGHQI